MIPRVVDELAVADGEQRGHEAHGVVALEDPVGGGREDEEDADRDLDAQQRHLERRVDKLLRTREPLQPAVQPAEQLAFQAGLVLGVPDRVLHLRDRAWDDGPEQQPEGGDERGVVEEDGGAARDPLRRSASTPGRMAAATVNARKSSASRIFSFQRARAHTTTPRTTMEATKARRAVSLMVPGVPPLVRKETSWKAAKPRACWSIATRRCAWRLGATGSSSRAALLGGRPVGDRRRRVDGTAPFAVAGGVVIGLAALVALRAVWKWERTRVVVTTDKVLLVGGTLRRRAHSVRLAGLEAIELEQTLIGQLLGYGTVVVGPMALDHVPKPKSVYRLVERLAE